LVGGRRVEVAAGGDSVGVEESVGLGLEVGDGEGAEAVTDGVRVEVGGTVKVDKEATSVSLGVGVAPRMLLKPPPQIVQ
jgi:hypothetical protein